MQREIILLSNTKEMDLNLKNRAFQREETPIHVPSRRSSRTKKPVRRLIEVYQAQKEATTPFEILSQTLQVENCEEELHPYAASADPDTLPDKAQFIEAMQNEVQEHTEKGHWRLVKRTEVPDGVQVMPTVWAMKRKWRIATREVYKWKARLNLDGSKQVKGINYEQTYAPVVGWGPIRLILTQAILSNWTTKQIDFLSWLTLTSSMSASFLCRLRKHDRAYVINA